MSEKTNPRFKSLYLARNWEEEIRGTIEFSTGHGDIKFSVSEDRALRLMAAVADLVVEDAKEIAEAMSLEVAEGFKLLTQTTTDKEEVH